MQFLSDVAVSWKRTVERLKATLALAREGNASNYFESRQSFRQRANKLFLELRMQTKWHQAPSSSESVLPQKSPKRNRPVVRSLTVE